MIFAALTIACASANAQSMLERLGQRAKEAVENKIGEKVENAVNNGIDKVTAKKQQGNDQSAENAQPAEEPQQQTAPVQAAPKYVEFEISPNEKNRYNGISNVRIANGAVPLYDRLATDGKIITYAITFETGKADIKPESYVEINRIAKLMQENPNLSFEVQGHCDASGSDKVNDPLSQKRAEAIVAAIVEQGIAQARLTAVGKGSHQPIADNSSDEGRAKNRRVEFVKK